VPLAVARQAWRGFNEHDCGFMAAALAFQIFFALIPLVLLVAGVFGLFVTSETLRNEVVSLMRGIYPGLADRRLVDEIVSSGGLTFGLGLVGTLWGVSALHGSLSRALRGVFGGRPSRFIHGRLQGLGFALLLTALAIVSFAASFVVQALAGWLRVIGLASTQRFALELVSPLAGLVAGFMLFLVVYRVSAPTRIPYRALFAGAAVAAVLWEVAKIGFAVVARESGSFHTYGALALAAGLLTWIYLTATILLVGAEVSKAAMERPTT
jgi:membrane protein